RHIHLDNINLLTIHNDMLMVKNHIFECRELKQFEKFKVSCKHTTPVAVRCFYESKDMEDCIRTAVWLGGDCDTIASMAAELRCAYDGGVTDEQAQYVLNNLPADMVKVLKDFNLKF